MDNQPLCPPRDKLVLVVDDDKNIRALLETCLGVEGFQVVCAQDGREAATKVEERRPDLIVSDLKMPGQDGYDFLRMLPGGGRTGLKILVITGSNLNASTLSLIKSETGALEFFAKPLDMGALIAAVHRHLGTAPSGGQGRGINDRA